MCPVSIDHSKLCLKLKGESTVKMKLNAVCQSVSLTILIWESANIDFVIIYGRNLEVWLFKWILSHIIIWLCLTRTGNYLIHKFDWLKWILTAVERLCFEVKEFQAKMQNHHDCFHKKKQRQRANFERIKFGSLAFASKISVSTNQLH